MMIRGMRPLRRRFADLMCVYACHTAWHIRGGLLRAKEPRSVFTDGQGMFAVVEDTNINMSHHHQMRTRLLHWQIQMPEDKQMSVDKPSTTTIPR